MMKKLLTGAVLCALPLCAFAKMREVTFHEVRLTDKPPVIDGDLSDPCWKDAQVHDKYYQFYRDDPPPAKTKTEIRFLYDAKGLYVAIKNWDKNTDKLKKTIITQGDPNVWVDDCAELYFDRYGNGTEYRRFVINCIGTMNDTMRLDEANMRYEWDADGWYGKTKIYPGVSWDIELFFPWNVFDEPMPKPGTTWAFNHHRYTTTIPWAYSVSAPGANQANTQLFGTLYFAGKNEKLDMDKLAKVIASRSVPPWGLSINGGLLQHDGQKISFEKLETVLDREQKKFDALLAQVEAGVKDCKSEEIAKMLQKVKDQYEKTKQESAGSLSYALRLLMLCPELEDILWEIKLEKM